MSETEVAEAKTDEVEFRLSWQETEGRLEGTLEAVNVSTRPVRLTGKPGLIPLGADGEPLGADTVVSLEARIPGYVILRPGEKATTPVGWAGWDGPAASGAFVVTWDGSSNRAVVHANGPHQPRSEGPPTNLWSSWWTTSGRR